MWRIVDVKAEVLFQAHVHATENSADLINGVVHRVKAASPPRERRLGRSLCLEP